VSGVDLRSLNDVRRHAEDSGKFRVRCAHFGLVPFCGLPYDVYLPCCGAEAFDLGPTLGDFKSSGHFLPPSSIRQFSPAHFQLFSRYFNDIRCPHGCAEFKRRWPMTVRRSAVASVQWAWARFRELLSSMNIHVHWK